MNLSDVRKVALALPDVEDATTYGSPAFKAGGKMFACVAIHKSAEPGSLMIRVDFDRRAELLAEAPDVYYLTPHYADYPAVLVRLSKVSKDALRDLLGGALRFVTTKKVKSRKAK